MTSDDITQGMEASCVSGSLSATTGKAETPTKPKTDAKGRDADSTVNKLAAQENITQWSAQPDEHNDTADVLTFVDRLLAGGAQTPLEMRVTAILLMEKESNLQLLKAAIKATRFDTADGWRKANEKTGRDMGTFALVLQLESPDIIVVEKALILRVLFSRLFPR